MYMSANFQVISDPVVFQNAQVTIYRAQKVVTMNPQMPGQNVLPLPAALLSQSVILSIWRLILKRMLLLIRSMILYQQCYLSRFYRSPYARSAKRPV